MDIPAFRTSFAIGPASWRISHADKILLLGSCFSTHIGQALQRAGFQVLSNPTGILFNPASIARTLQLLAGQLAWGAERLLQREGYWMSWDHQGQTRDTGREALEQSIRAGLREASDWLAQTDVLMLTPGTAIAFYEKIKGEVVSNCHKFPADHFERRVLSPEHCHELLAEIISNLLERKPALRILLTVSPVRHSREGMVQNQRSKASLLLACAELERRFPNAVYFPAYELMMDDLRDYRFYEADMIHPSATAIEYIWARLRQSFFDSATEALVAEAEALARESAHLPLYPDSAAQQERLQKLAVRQAALEERLAQCRH